MIIPFEIGLELVDDLSDAEGAGVVVLGIADAFRKVVFCEDLWQIAAGTVAMGAQIAWHEILIIG